jgi:hypothetical protein
LRDEWHTTKPTAPESKADQMKTSNWKHLVVLMGTVLGLSASGFFGPSFAKAGPAFDALVPGKANELEDDDWEAGLTGKDTRLDVGELLFGMAEVTAINGTQGTALGATFTAVFALKVVTKTPLPGGFFTFTFGPPTNADWTTLGTRVGAWPTRSSPQTMMIVYEDVGKDRTRAPFFINPSSSLSVVSVTGDGTALWEFGHLGLPGETWFALTNTDNLAAKHLSGLFSARLNVTHTYPAAVRLSLMRVLPDPSFPGFRKDSAGTNPNAAQLHVTGGSLTRSGSTKYFPVKSDADLWVVPTPEPASWVLLAGMGLLLGATAHTRHFSRRKHAAQQRYGTSRVKSVPKT